MERTVSTTDVTQLLRPGADGPAEAGDERQNTSVEENVQLEKKGKGFSTREACQECVLFRRYNAALLPLLQSGEYGHEVFVLRMWGDASEPGIRSGSHFFGP